MIRETQNAPSEEAPSIPALVEGALDWYIEKIKVATGPVEVMRILGYAPEGVCRALSTAALLDMSACLTAMMMAGQQQAAARAQQVTSPVLVPGRFGPKR